MPPPMSIDILPPSEDDIQPEDWNPGVLNNYLRSRHIVDDKKRSWKDSALQRVKVPVSSAKGLLGNNTRNLRGYEEVCPRARTAEQKRKLYKFTQPSKDPFPPHLRSVPEDDEVGLETIFNENRLKAVHGLLGGILNDMQIHGAPGADAATMADIERNSRNLLRCGHGVHDSPNISERSDWYTDAVFAQQFFTGPNPMIVKRATIAHVEDFIVAANQEIASLGNQSSSIKKRLHEIAVPAPSPEVQGEKYTLENAEKALEHAKARVLPAALKLLEEQAKVLRAQQDKKEHEKTSTLWVADYSYFRAAAGIAANDDIRSDEWPESPNDATSESDKDGNSSSGAWRYGCAPIVLFELQDLTPEGTEPRRPRGHQMHPLAIVIDYKGSIETSITIFNNRQRANAAQEGTENIPSERDDWPWRYAKTCAMAADWADHQIRVHLTEAHFIDEAIIVAAHRSFADDHSICELLSPHWKRTLPLNEGARLTLVPRVVVPIGPFTRSQAMKLIRYYYYDNFHWTQRYAPNDLQNRGFPLTNVNFDGVELSMGDLKGVQFQNFSFGRNIAILWQVVRHFVDSYLKAHDEYNDDESVSSDEGIQHWVNEMQTEKFEGTDRYGGNIKTFPTIKTRDDLVDALTMCIHIASPQHNAINYLQNYYMAFVINKPPSLYAKPPQTREELRTMNEATLLESFPVGERSNHRLMTQWLLASHLPWLLSYQPSEKLTLFNYARTLAQTDSIVRSAAEEFKEDLTRLGLLFARNSLDISVLTRDRKHRIKYEVMDPKATAVSILL